MIDQDNIVVVRIINEKVMDLNISKKKFLNSKI
jgi:hypothetical protein